MAALEQRVTLIETVIELLECEAGHGLGPGIGRNSIQERSHIIYLIILYVSSYREYSFSKDKM